MAGNVNSIYGNGAHEICIKLKNQQDIMKCGSIVVMNNKLGIV
jgi:hypothetical protein